jgi:P27 family predicted phage terminase small subunit
MRGNPGRRPLNAREPLPVGDLKDAPQHFGDELRAVWAYAIQYAPAGLLKMLDAAVLETWCCALVTYRHAMAELRASGSMTVEGSRGPMPSPYIAIANKQALLMLRTVEHLGFSPATRTRISIGQPPKAQDDWQTIATG